MSSHSEDFEGTSISIDHLLNEYEGWCSIPDRDDYDLIARTKALYRFAIAHYNESGIDLLLRALSAFEAPTGED